MTVAARSGSTSEVAESIAYTPRCIGWRCALGVALFFLHGAVARAQEPRGSVYVPLDSWVYPAFDRLAGMGAINKHFVGLRPWTRLQCAQLVQDAEENLLDGESKNREAISLYEALDREFRAEIQSLNGGSVRRARLESVYTRALGISRTPLRDGYHFGQTLDNDFGRPFNTGFNDVSGFSAAAEGGRFFAYVRGEYQHSPAYGGLAAAQQSLLEQMDGTTSEPYSQASGAVNRFEFLDSYVGLRLGSFDITFGKQSLWWGPGTMGAMLVSDNAEPVAMLKINQVEPIVLPGILEYLGPMRVQAFMGRLAGDHFPPRPYFHGEKVVFKPTPNLEVGISRTTEAFGQGIPMTLGNWFATYLSASDVCCVANPQNFPGKRQGGLDFSYRLPHLRKWVTLYSDSFSEDDVNPVVNPSRAMFNPGIYVAQIPRLPKFDFRLELANTRHRETAYTSFFYKDAYLNNGFLLGDAVGRNGSAWDASSAYWFSPTGRVQLGWREQRVSRALIPAGGAQNSLRMQADWFVQEEMEFSLLAQHERWAFPLLAAGEQSDNVVSLQLTVYPKRGWLRFK